MWCDPKDGNQISSLNSRSYSWFLYIVVRNPILYRLSLLHRTSAMQIVESWCFNLRVTHGWPWNYNAIFEILSLRIREGQAAKSIYQKWSSAQDTFIVSQTISFSNIPEWCKETSFSLQRQGDNSMSRSPPVEVSINTDYVVGKGADLLLCMNFAVMQLIKWVVRYAPLITQYVSLLTQRNNTRENMEEEARNIS